MVQLNRQYERVEQQPITIKVVGVGGAGCNILDRVMLDGIEEVDLLAINTDAQSLTASVAAHKVQLGRNLTRGLGCGGDPELGEAAAEEGLDEIRSVLQGGAMIFICAGLGGGTGSGAAPVIARLAKEENALVLGVTTVPFSFEGRRRCLQASESLNRLRELADAVICFENDRMAEIALPRMGIHEAFAAADLTISQSIRSVANLLQHPGLLHIGFDDVCSVLRRGNSRALFGFGEAEGENRAHEALARALKNPLMNRGELLEDAYHAIVHICGNGNVTLGEVQIVMEELNRHINDQTQLFMGIGVDPRRGNKLSISILSSLGDNAERMQLPPKITHSAVVVNTRIVEPLQPPNDNPPAPQALNGNAVQIQEITSHKEVNADALLVVPVRPAAPKTEPKVQSPQLKNAEAKQETLQFEPVSRGRFEKSEPTIIDGQDLDVPTFLRRQLKVR